MKTKTFDYVMLGMAVFVMGIWPVAYSFVNTTNPLTLALYISVFGTLASFAVMLYKGTQKEVVKYFTQRTPFLSVLITGVLTYTMVTLIFSFTTHYISAALLAVIYRAWPLIALLLAPFIMKERITKLELLGVAIAFGGMAYVFLSGTGITLTGIAIPAALLIVLAAVFDAVVSTVQKRYNYELTSSIFAYNLISFAVLLPLALYFNAAFESYAISTIAVIAAIGVLQNVLLTFLFVMAYRSIKTSVASNAFMFVPFVTMILGFFILGEPILLSYLIIAATVCIGFAVVSLKPKAISSYISSESHKTDDLPTIYDVTSAFISTKSNTVSGAMQGSGRVLAFYKKVSDATEMKDEVNTVNNMNAKIPKTGDCFLFTNMEPVAGVNSSDLEYVKEIVGHDDGDLLILGAGDPELIEGAFCELHRNLPDERIFTGDN